MPKNVTKSSLKDKIKPSAVQSHADDETRYGIIDLPGGLSGIAQLVDCKFDTYKKGENEGEYYWYSAGVLVEVDQPEFQHLIGQRTSITIPACDTKNQAGEVTSQNDHVDRIMNEMRKLGASTAGASSGEDLDNLSSALLEAQPYFRFTTTESKATAKFKARIWQNWHGNQGLENYAGPAGDDQVQDNTASAAKTEATAPADDNDDAPDLEALAKSADSDDDADAQRLLTELADKAGVDRDAVANAKNWAEVAEMISSSQTNSDSTTPDVGEVWEYKPPKAKKAVSCEVISVDADAGTVNLKNLDDGKSNYKNVKFTSLVNFGS